VVQEVYCRLLAEDGRRLAACRARGEVQVISYLRRVVERVAIDQARRERAAKRGGGWRGRVSAETWNLADPRANPEELLLAAERRRIFLEEWNKLVTPAAGQRNLRILHLALIEGRSSREIAAILGELSPSGVDTVVSRLRQHLARLGLPLPRRAQEGPRTRRAEI
jgi:DNA-directed RNA polymerase specialized sigma24 family protein